MTIGANTTITVDENAILIVEGNLILNGTLVIKNGASVTIKKKISGGGSLDLRYRTEGYYTGHGKNTTYVPPETTGYFSVLGGLGEQSISLSGVDGDGDVYISDAVIIANGRPSISISDPSSAAYTTSMENMATAGEAGLLPIELTSFTATATDYGFVFNWVTASEENNDYFTLEYSIDGIGFNEIDYVHGAGTTSETSEYTYRWNEAPEFDVVYFRLKQTDYNGEYSYSDVIVASRKKSSGANGTFRYGPLNLQIQDGELRYIQK